MALLWHGHFATHENKVRDYRKMRQQIELFERGATGNLRELTIEVAQNPAMLYFLDAQFNVKGAPNENFAREVMELFTMGVGTLHRDGRARVRARVHGVVLRRPRRSRWTPPSTTPARRRSSASTGAFDGVDVLKIIFEQPVTAEYLAGKIYRFLVRDDLSPGQINARLGLLGHSARRLRS